MNKPKPVRIHILDKEYLVACPEDERDSLYNSAEHLTSKMKEIRDNGKIVGTDRIAVMAALNLAHELLTQKQDKNDYYDKINTRIRALQGRVDDALNLGNQLEL
ncbi:MAG: cell division protein ZapA [Gammaproteobacteria bacterium]